MIVYDFIAFHAIENFVFENVLICLIRIYVGKFFFLKTCDTIVSRVRVPFKDELAMLKTNLFHFFI